MLSTRFLPLREGDSAHWALLTRHITRRAMSRGSERGPLLKFVAENARVKPSP
jgi:hypothetical protein